MEGADRAEPALVLCAGSVVIASWLTLLVAAAVPIGCDYRSDLLVGFHLGGG